MSYGTVTIEQFPNNTGSPPKGTPFDAGPSGVTFLAPGLNPQSPIQVLTSYNAGVFTLDSKPPPVTAVLSSSWQAQSYQFVDANGVAIGSKETVSQCPATLFVQAPNVINSGPQHGGGEVALLTFLTLAAAFLLFRRLRRRWA